ncbi:terminase small subunit [Methylobacterium sp. E-025]|uniref:terminase small subunit n=1 Tax=Methylobacterium sp. E-025 TaxID=2836561 RepID=UPI001FB9D981|nr:terminase small subunit [Methylobacterium sp. E-025]MCJ2111919.1 terminase small subunit [Methylobacterium sp. E-025]
MIETVNRKQVASHYGISLPTVDAWVRKGCPFVTRGSKGVEWEFDLAAVQDWASRFWARPTQVVTRTGLKTFSTTEKAEVVKAFGHVARHIGTWAADMAVKAGGSIEIAYALNQMLCIRFADEAEAYLATRGVAEVDLVEMFCRREDEPDWQSVAQEAGGVFDEDACEKFVNGIDWLKPSPEVLEVQAARLRERERPAILKDASHG